MFPLLASSTQLCSVCTLSLVVGSFLSDCVTLCIFAFWPVDYCLQRVVHFVVALSRTRTRVYWYLKAIKRMIFTVWTLNWGENLAGWEFFLTLWLTCFYWHWEHKHNLPWIKVYEKMMHAFICDVSRSEWSLCAALTSLGLGLVTTLYVSWSCVLALWRCPCSVSHLLFIVFSPHWWWSWAFHLIRSEN